MGFENTLDSLTYEYTDEITIYTGDSYRILLNPTFICEENDYVVSLFVFEDSIDTKTIDKIREYIDTHTTRKIYKPT